MRPVGIALLMNQIKAGAVLNYVIIGLNILLGLLYTPYMLRMLGQNEYGLYSLVASVIAYLTLLDFGFGPTVVRYTAKYRAEGKVDEQYSLFGLFFVMYSIIGVVAFIAGLVLYFNIDWMFDRTMTPDDISQARIMIMLLLVNLAVTFPMSVFGSIITAYEDFVFQKLVIICRMLLSTAAIVALLYLGYKAVAMVVVQTVCNICLLGVNFWFCRRKLGVKLHFAKFKWSFIRELLGFSVWVFLGDVMFKFYYSTGQFVLGATNGTVAISVFALGVTLMQMYIMFSSGVSGVLLPRLTSMVAKHSSDHEFADMFLRVGRIQFFIMSLIIGGFVVFGRSFISFWAGPGYDDVYVICLTLFFTTLPPLIQNTGIIILQARNQQKFRSVMLVCVSAISLVVQIVLAKYYGAIGCAVAIGVANAVGQGFILNVYYHSKQHLEIGTFWKEILKMSIVPIVITIVYVVIWRYLPCDSLWIFGLGISSYIFFYVALGWLFCLNIAEKSLIKKPLIEFKNKIFRKC